MFAGDDFCGDIDLARSARMSGSAGEARRSGHETELVRVEALFCFSTWCSRQKIVRVRGWGRSVPRGAGDRDSGRRMPQAARDWGNQMGSPSSGQRSSQRPRWS